MNVPQEVQEEVVTVLHEKLFWNGFTMQCPIDNDDFYVVDSEESDLYMYKNTKLIEVCQNIDGHGFEIKEYI